MERFFADLERAEAADFYAAVGLLGRVFVNLEAEAFLINPNEQFRLSPGWAAWNSGKN